jgi:hypothetical protein
MCHGDDVLGATYIESSEIPKYIEELLGVKSNQKLQSSKYIYE